MCQQLGVSRAGFYRWLRPVRLSPRQLRHQTVAQAIITLFADSFERLGRRPIRQHLAEQQLVCSPGMVHRIMQEHGLAPRRRRAWKRTTSQDPAARIAHIPNHLLAANGQRCFTSATPGTRTVGDITYFLTTTGWRYLAVVIDLATRAVIGWSIGERMPSALVSNALVMAHTHGRLAPDAIFHSDRGTQYTSADFQCTCTQLGVRQSFGATGVCWDNAVAESFFATLKGDVGELGTAPPAEALHRWLVLWIEGWYNRRRPHSYNAGVPPMIALDRLNSPSIAVSNS